MIILINTTKSTNQINNICSNQIYIWSEIRELDHAIQFYPHLKKKKKKRDQAYPRKMLDHAIQILQAWHFNFLHLKRQRHAFEIIKVEVIITMFFGRACIIGARDIFEWILRLGTYIHNNITFCNNCIFGLVIRRLNDTNDSKICN